MSIDITSSFSYGFKVEGRSIHSLLVDLGFKDEEYECISIPDSEALRSLGFKGVSIIAHNGDDTWESVAICASNTYESFGPKYDEGVWTLDNNLVSEKVIEDLEAIRSKIFSESEEKPDLGWMVTSCIW